MSSCVVQVRIDEDVKKNIDNLFEDLGLDTPTAVRMFFSQSLKCQGLPFDVKRSNPKIETLKAMDEIEEQIKNKKGKVFKTVDDLFEDLEN